MYSYSQIQDYPSISQINLKVKQNAVNVIFAVTKSQISVYNKLSKHVEGSSSAELNEDSGNIVDLVKEEYSVSYIIFNYFILLKQKTNFFFIDRKYLQLSK